MIKNVLVVCVGNICRSPMGEALLKHSNPELDVSSAGLGAMVGSPADPYVLELMNHEGLDVSGHRARQIESWMLQRMDLVLVMEQEHKRFIEQKYPFARGKVFRMVESQKIDIADPYKRDRDAFERALHEIKIGVDTWSRRIRALT